MNVLNRVGMVLLAIWLIVSGVLSLLGLSTGVSSAILAALAIVAGILILPLSGDWSKKLDRLLLGIWLILTGLLPLVDTSFISATVVSVIMAVLAVLAGIFMLRNRWT
jgi:hypothetical protein